MIFAIQSNRIVLDGTLTPYRSPLDVLPRYQARVNASLYLDELFPVFARAPKDYPILIDGRVLVYVLTSRPHIGYALGPAKSNLDPNKDEIVLAACCPSDWTHEELGGVYMKNHQVIKPYQEMIAS